MHRDDLRKLIDQYSQKFPEHKELIVLCSYMAKKTYAKCKQYGELEDIFQELILKLFTILYDEETMTKLKTKNSKRNYITKALKSRYLTIIEHTSRRKSVPVKPDIIFDLHPAKYNDYDRFESDRSVQDLIFSFTDNVKSRDMLYKWIFGDEEVFTKLEEEKKRPVTLADIRLNSLYKFALCDWSSMKAIEVKQNFISYCRRFYVEENHAPVSF